MVRITRMNDDTGEELISPQALARIKAELRARAAALQSGVHSGVQPIPAIGYASGSAVDIPPVGTPQAQPNPRTLPDPGMYRLPESPCNDVEPQVGRFQTRPARTPYHFYERREAPR